MKKLLSIRTIILAGSLLLQLSTLCFQSRSAAGDVDLSFDPGSGVNGTVHAAAVQPDGKVIIGGEFTTVKGLARSKVARLNADGSGDNSFDAGPSSVVYEIALQPDGKVFAGGDFGIKRLNSDGRQDTNFNASINTIDNYENFGVYSIAIQSDGKVLIGGYFSTVDGTNRNGIARLNADGSLDSSFNPGTGADGGVFSIALQSDGKVLIVGNFTTVNGTNHIGIARLNANGSLDNSFNPALGLSVSVISVALQTNGKVLFGGYFSTVNGTNRNNIARLNGDGSLDSTFDPGTGPNNTVFSIALQSDGKVVIGGGFTVVNGTNRNNLARLNSDGSLDGSFNPGTGADGYVISVGLYPDDTVLIGGGFTAINGTNRNRVARLNADGSLDGSFDPGTGISGDGPSVNSVVAQPDGKVLIGGGFSTVNGTSRNGLARLNANGSLDNNFIPGTGADIGVRIVLQPDGKVLLQNARLNADGSLDYSFHAGIAVYNWECPPQYQCSDGAVFSVVAVRSDGKILVGGESTHIECNPDDGGCSTYSRPFVARVNADGSPDTNFNFGTGPNSRVYSIAAQSDGKMLIGGSFTTVNGTNRNGIARLNADGSLDSTFNPGTGANGEVSTVVVQSDGKVLIGGYFSAVNGTNRQGIARLNANGGLDTSFNPGTGLGGVTSVALQPDGKVLIGGSFTTVNGTNRNRIARLNADGSLDSSFNPGTGANGNVRSIALQSDGKVLIGGDFLTVNGVLRPYVARLYGDSPWPSLNIARSNASVIVSWPVMGLNFQLQETTDLSLPNSWSPVAQAAVTNGNQVSVNIPTVIGSKFFRLNSQ